MAFIEHADPKAPVLHRVVNEFTKLGADNPDNFYQTAALNGSYEYRITGQRNTIAYLSFGTQAGNYGQGGGLPPTGHIESDQIEMDEQGRFELTLSRHPQDGNWLPMTPETGGDIMRRSSSETVEMMEVDLADMASVHRFCDCLAQRGIRIDIAVLNAGLMPRKAKKTPQGYETMFAVHFLSNRVMIDRWLRDGVIRPSGLSDDGETPPSGSGNEVKPSSPGHEVPRIVFISSESHRSAHAIDFERFGAFTEYGMKDGLKHYGLSKLVQCTFATELSRRLNPGEEVEVAVHAMCPRGMATNIAREAPALLKPILNLAFRCFFQSPEKAAGPVTYLCCREEPGSATGMYLHMMQRKAVSPAAADLENGNRLWEASEALLAKSREVR